MFSAFDFDFCIGFLFYVLYLIELDWTGLDRTG
jgi:hypothetical protein